MRKLISHAIHVNLYQFKFKVLKSAILVICAPNTISQRRFTVYSLQTYRVLFLSLTKVKPKLMETKTTLGFFPKLKTIGGGPKGSQHKLN